MDKPTLSKVRSSAGDVKHLWKISPDRESVDSNLFVEYGGSWQSYTRSAR